MNRPRLILAFAICAIITGFLYIDIPACLDHYAACSGKEISITIVSSRYRTLQPILTNMLLPNGTEKQVLFFNFIEHSLLSIASIVGLYIWLSRSTKTGQQIIGVLIFTGIFLLAYPLYMMSLSTSIEIVCVVWALVFIRHYWIVGIITIIASINRETGMVIAALYCAYHWDALKYSSHKLVAGVSLIVFSGLITAAIHIAVGGGDVTRGFRGTLEYNIGNLPDILVTNLPLFPLFAGVLAAYRPSPIMLKRMLCVAGFYLLAILVGGAWVESMRLVLPITPIILPAILYQRVDRP